jgi:RNA polymerase sigma-54 factor
MIKQQLTQKQQQKLSPLQIQQIKLLELTGLEIENRIHQELEENPALEEVYEDSSDAEDGIDAEQDAENSSEEDMILGDYLTEDDIPDYKLQQPHYSEQTAREEIPYSENESLQEYLLAQFRLRNLSEDQFRIGEYLIGNIDETGYIRRSMEAISDDLAFQYGWEVAISEIEHVLKVIQQLDPPGIAAENLQDCLLIQLKRKEKNPARNHAVQILETCFDAFSKRRYDKIAKTLNITETDLKNVIKEIIILNPRPGNAWETNLESKMAHITPDFFVETVNGELFLNMQENIPELRISKEYCDMLAQYAQSGRQQHIRERKEVGNFIKQKIDAANWFIDAIRQRNITLRNTMWAIVELQRDFFLTGEEANLKPMILKDVSELCGYNISTISRVSNSKYVQTNFGIYPLRYFFSEAATNDEGEEISTREIKLILKNCIAEEDKTSPLTDETLMKELKKRGYEVARRTVAKYREQLNIPVSRLRKEI